MVDSNDRDRVVEARDELHRMLNEVRVDVVFLTCIVRNQNAIFRTPPSTAQLNFIVTVKHDH